MKKNSRINIKATDALKSKVVAHVTKKEKSISSYITRLIEKDLQTN